MHIPATLIQDLFNAFDGLSQGYAITIVLLLIARLIKGKTAWLVNLLAIANCIVLVIAVFRVGRQGWGFIELYRFGYLYEQFAFYDRVLGKYYWAYILLYIVQVLPLLFLFKKVRTSFVLPVILLLTPFPVIERYIIIFTSLMDDYLPATWSYYL